MTPRLEACYFDLGDGRWRKLARALDWSARQHCPGWQVRVQSIPENLPPTHHATRTQQANTQKLDYWQAVIESAELGDQLLLIDADTLILRPLDDIWERPFDLAYTTKPPGARFPFNGGVLFMRVSPAVKAFMATWVQENRRMLRDRAYHLPFLGRYGGINQSAFGALLERGALADLAVVELPCLEWNCEDSSWAAFDPAVTRILHVKSTLRQPIADRTQELKPLRDLWQAADLAARRAAAPVAATGARP
jgi:hypothetical protein